jgi:glycosyltransferase involved in cell wall biosynthesis
VGLTSVVIPARNAAAVLADQLAALAQQDYAGEWEVVVVDHRSTDATAAIAAGFVDRLPGLRTIRCDRRGGANAPRNDGARAARGDVVAFCDADDVAAPGWLAGLVTGAADADIVGGRLETERLNSGRTRWWRAGAAKTVTLVDATRFGFLPYAPASNVAVRAEALRAVGGFAEEYRYGCDEMALMWRAQLAGYRLAESPDAVMHYRFRDRLGSMALQHFRYARMEPRLFREFHKLGMPRASTRDALARWRAVVRHVPAAAGTPEERGEWWRDAAQSAGRAWGSVANGVAYL